MFRASMDSKIVRVVYGFAFPILVVFFLLGVSSFIERPRIFGSIGSDLVIRFLLTVWFCGLYLRLSRISSFSYYPNKKWTKTDVGPVEKYFYWLMSAIFGFVCGIITWWTISWFFLGPPSVCYAISVVNCLVIIWPLWTHYWVLKL